MKCGVQITNIDKQVGEVRSRYPGPIREIICIDCHLARGEQLIKRTRQSLGLNYPAGGSSESGV